MDLTKRISSCVIGVPVLYGPFDYEGKDKKKYKVWEHADFFTFSETGRRKLYRGAERIDYGQAVFSLCF